MPKLINTEINLQAYGGFMGAVILKCKIKNTIVNIKYLVVEGHNKCMVGINTCTKLNLIKKIDKMELENSFKSKEE